MSELMRIDLISAVPESFQSIINTSIIKNAIKKGVVKIVTHNLHDYADNPFGHIDDYPYGGSPGMLIKCQPIFDCIEKLQSERKYDEVIFMAADGELLNQKTSNELSLKKNIIVLAGHYKGIDQRVRDALITKEISIGDYVLSGGELPALVLIDSIVRLVPGVLSDPGSALQDSYQDGMLEAPIYTRPAEYRGMKVPDVLLSGDPKKVDEWKYEKSLEKTQRLRPDLIK